MEHEPNFDDIEVTELKPVETVGIQSHVKRFSELKQETVDIGHTVFFDFEDVDLEDVKGLVKNRLGFGFIFKSSERNFHVIVPVIKSVAEIHDIKESIRLDCDAHADIGLKKGCWTLRASEKGDKPAPEFEAFVKGDINLKSEIYSEPHVQYLMESIPEDTVGYNYAHNIFHECKCIGDTFNAVKYQTHENNHDVDAQAEE